MTKKSISATIDPKLKKLLEEKRWERVKKKAREREDPPENPKDLFTLSPLIEEILWKGLEDSLVKERFRKKIMEICERRNQDYKEILNEVIEEGLDFI